MLRAVLALAAALYGFGAEAATGWRVAETRHFRIWSQEREEVLRASARKLEIYHELLAQQFVKPRTPPAEDKLDIYVSPAIRRGTGMTAGVGGFYAASATGIAAFVDRVPGTGIDADDVLLHEYAHHFMLSRMPFAFPAWYVEGFAEYFATTHILPDRVEMGRMAKYRARELAWSEWIPLDRLLTAQGEAARRLPPSAVYAQGWLFVHYCFRDPKRADALAKFLYAVGTGSAPAPAFEAAFGTTLKAADRDLLAYARGKGGEFTFSRLRPGVVPEPAPATVRDVPPAQAAVLLEEAKLRVGVVPKRLAPAMLRATRAAAGRYAGDPFVGGALALAELRGGNAAAALAVVEPLLAAAPRDWRLHWLEGTALVELGAADEAGRGARFAAARRALGEANRLAPLRPPVLLAYASTRLWEVKPPAANTVEMLLLARERAPQVIEYALAAGQALMRTGRWAEAEIVLAPVAFRPHGGCAVELAARLLASARARAMPAGDAAPFRGCGDAEEG